MNINECSTKEFKRHLKFISSWISREVGRVPILLSNRDRITFQYYQITAIRPYKKGELYLDGSNHIVNVAERDGEPHWMDIILRKVT